MLKQQRLTEHLYKAESDGRRGEVTERQSALMGMFFCEKNKSMAIRKSIYTDTYYHLCAVSL